MKWDCLCAKEAPVMLSAIHILPGTEPSLAFTVFYLQKCYLASFSEILLRYINYVNKVSLICTAQIPLILEVT